MKKSDFRKKMVFASFSKKLIVFFISLLSFTQLSAQNKGRLYVFWGWNRTAYTKSNIQFTGENYDFTLQKVDGRDRQTPFALDPYFNPALMTIPQTNLRVGYFIKEHYTISAGIDHMKYVMVQNQTVKINGNISNTSSVYDKSYNNEDIQLTEDFLTFEHTDGLNYANVEFCRYDELFDFKKIKLPNIQLSVTEGVGVGLVVPKTNTKLIGKERYDEFHLAGYGVNGKVGLNLRLFKYFFLQSEYKFGWINMPDIRTTKSKSDKAKQNFAFSSANFVFGVTIPLIK